jgi:hypothetical protein
VSGNEVRFLYLPQLFTFDSSRKRIGSVGGKDALLGRLLGEDHADAAAIGSGLAGGGVVHLEHEVGACFDELAWPGGSVMGTKPGAKPMSSSGDAALSSDSSSFLAPLPFLFPSSFFSSGTNGIPGLASPSHLEPGSRTNAMM